MKMFLSENQIRRVHLEITEKCNAACPLCIRTNPNGLRAQNYIGRSELNLSDIHVFFPEHIREQLVAVHLCGSYGDPIMARDCLEICDYFASKKCVVSLSTNGSAREKKWWEELGSVLSIHPQARVDFHIDGLSDTNSYYRRNTCFEKILENAEAFIKAGGKANWEFIPFKHNEHQLEEARQLSIKMGFARFTVKKSNWMFSKVKPRITFTTRQGESCYLEAPSEKQLPRLKNNRVSLASISTETDDIVCLAQKEREIYISCEGILYPCCWTARFGRNIYLGKKNRDGFSTLFKENNGRKTFDLRKTDLQTALHALFFKSLGELWQIKEPPVCYKKCGKKNQPEKVKTIHPKHK